MVTTNGTYVQVQSVYGPGTVIAWLLTILAVLISWILNNDTRRKDSISLDLIAVLLLPITAAVHFFYQLIRLPVSIVDALTSGNADIIQLTAAFEAPLNVCETFSMMSLILVGCCGPWHSSPPKWKRFSLVIPVGLLSWVPENLLFATATLKGVTVHKTVLSRPYLFSATPIIESVWAFLIVCAVYIAGWRGIYWLIKRQSQRSRRHVQDAGHVPDLNENGEGRSSPFRPTDRESGRHDTYDGWESDAARQSSSMSLGFSICISLASAGFSLVWSKTKIKGQESIAQENTRSRTMPFFIPKSTNSLRELDQALALGSGLLVLVYALVAAWRSRRAASIPVARYIGRRRSI